MHQSTRPSYLKRAFAGAALAITILGFCAPQAANAQYVIDDGIADNSVGLTSGGTATFFNMFPVIPGSNLINSIGVSFGFSGNPNPALNGQPFTVGIWSDPNGDGNPTDGVLLAQAPGIISGASTDTFVNVSITPTLVLTPNFFVGFQMTHAAGSFPAGFDQTAPLANRSWVNTNAAIGNLAGSITIESAGLSGNWMIRASSIPEPSTYALVGLGLAGIVFLRRRVSRAIG